jgi:hypothetical protein
MAISVPCAARRRNRELVPDVDSLRRRQAIRRIVHLHSLGPRALGEFLGEFCREHGHADDLFELLDRYLSLNRRTLDCLGGVDYRQIDGRCA